MLTLDSVCEFLWTYGQDFLLYSDEGKYYMWSCPDYSGDNTIRLCNAKERLTLCFSDNLRNKGKHTIREYCGEDVKILPETEDSADKKVMLEWFKEGVARERELSDLMLKSGDQKQQLSRVLEFIKTRNDILKSLLEDIFQVDKKDL